jgi:predicted MFS family arabinose efflux permease
MKLYPSRKVARDGMAARILLSFLASAGLYYVNIMPALIDGLRTGLAFSNQQAGQVGAFNMYGGAGGALLVSLLVRRLPWRASANLLLAGLVGADLLSMGVASPALLMALRFAHGLMGGMLVGIGFSVFARGAQPDRTFGVLLVVQTIAGGLGVLLLPPLVPVYGTPILFWALILFSCVTVGMVAFLPDYPEQAPSAGTPSGERAAWPLAAALLAVFLFQAANMGLYAYVIGLGKSAGLAPAFVSNTLGLANWAGAAGAVLVVVLSTRYGILWPITGAIITGLAASAAFFHSGIAWVWIVANLVSGMAWNFGIAYLLGMCARLGRHGRGAVWAGFASKVGLASGPMMGSYLVSDDNYGPLIVMALLCMGAATVLAALPARRLDRGAAAAAGTRLAPAPLP